MRLFHRRSAVQIKQHRITIYNDIKAIVNSETKSLIVNDQTCP